MANDFERGLQGLESGLESSTANNARNFAEAPPGSHPGVDAMRAQFGDAVVSHVVMSGDEHVVYVAADRNLEIMRWLKEDPQQRYDLLKDVTAVDYGGQRPLEVLYELWSIPHRRQLRVKCVLPLQALEIDSVVTVWNTANWHEREAYDMFGINFRNHPDMRRILMPENYAEGHPLRKDFPLRGRFSRAEQTRRALEMDVEDHYTPTELEVGGEALGTADSDLRTKQKAARAASQNQGYDRTPGDTSEDYDPALGDVPWTQRAPVPGGDAAQGASE
ncbi:MAG TPA: NADH-quinone oxidoreductase subunit C [Longimicrobiales bacterium]|nr:NADH-quinone oxidoreductase subunit C [Longimicrobiales bacterium]